MEKNDLKLQKKVKKPIEEEKNKENNKKRKSLSSEANFQIPIDELAPRVFEVEEQIIPNSDEIDTLEPLKKAEVFVAPAIILRGPVFFPGNIQTFEIGRDKSVKALEQAVALDSIVFLIPQKDVSVASPSRKDFGDVGIVGIVKQFVKNTPGIYQVVVECGSRGFLQKMEERKDSFYAHFTIHEDAEQTLQDEVYLEEIKKLVKEIATLGPKVPNELIDDIMDSFNASDVSSKCASSLVLDQESRIKILNELVLTKRLEHVIIALTKELEILKIEKTIARKVRENVDKNQREYFLREQMKVISQELGDDNNEIEDLHNALGALKIKNKDIISKISKEIDKLERLPSHSPEYSVTRNYLDLVLSLPWNKITKDNNSMKNAKQILDEDHFGLEKVKERVLEHLSVHALTKSLKGSILCFVGPPGVGKTSIARSIARALGKKYVRMSLGGVSDEAEIRGHRKTYIGAMPGKVIANIKQAKSSNPLFLFDEIDKVSTSLRGDPQSALLEVLDPEINSTFRDNYLEVEFDLSKVMFVATANTLDTISRPLLDRMEVIELNGYTMEEKLEIAKRYLIPKKKNETGLKNVPLKIDDGTIMDIIYLYTREAGVRNLEREIGNIMCKVALQIAMGAKTVRMNRRNLHKFLGVARFSPDSVTDVSTLGVVNGLAWTSVGGTTLTIEATLMKGKGEIILTGKLGDVMKESARTALSFIESNAEKFGIAEDVFSQKDIHIHFPEGATPKDGPSAGIAIATALLSIFTERKVLNSVAMTGEVTLRGKVLPIGGLKEKVLAARRHNISKIIIPSENKKDLENLPPKSIEKIEFVFVDSAFDVFNHALEKQ